MEKTEQIVCTLRIPKQIYMELTEGARELFIEQAGGYSTVFPADTREDDFLGEFIQAFCEVVLVINNPKYEVTDDCKVSTELLALGQSEKSFSMLVNIQYPGSEKIYHDILAFQEISQSPGKYVFELLGDQTFFSVE
ncbi:hypothetical protein [Anaeromicropila populeti]|uniref:Uncharacterized protein n=1 Tax=Anaeromicropila populeti TaxID=37658 RepID=A0A1I6ID32_9FIRM|nr:hypothetical protein [Anaeromicropila populeti]SFR64618.1 hypothetical protein SAMN05661086_00711 [Anaeromicropila populeti]